MEGGLAADHWKDSPSHTHTSTHTYRQTYIHAQCPKTDHTLTIYVQITTQTPTCESKI
jgi:hypothetical protein